MEPAAILEQLTYSDDLPRDALRAAAELRADMVPLFVERIENYVAADAAKRESRGLSSSFFTSWAIGGKPRPTTPSRASCAAHPNKSMRP